MRRSRAQERRDARDYGGRVQSGSGCGTFQKGDVRTSDLLIENKRTDKQQMTIKAAWLDKIRDEALREGREPVLGIEIAGREWVLLPKEDYITGD
jgi:hypothetical protein